MERKWAFMKILLQIDIQNEKIKINQIQGNECKIMHKGSLDFSQATAVNVAAVKSHTTVLCVTLIRLNNK